MNTPNMRQPSGPECARYALLLPQFRQGTLDTAEDIALRAHLPTCAYCQAQLATYDRLDGALRTYIDHFTPTAPAADDLVRAVVAHVPLASPAATNENHHRPLRVRQKDDMMFDQPDFTDEETKLPGSETWPPRSQRPSRRHPVLATIAALVLIGLAATLFTVFARSNNGPANGGPGTPTTTAQATVTMTPGPNATSTPLPVNGAVNSGHPCMMNAEGQIGNTQFGDLKVSSISLTNLAYPSQALPATLDRSKPYQLPANLSGSSLVNPTLSEPGGFGFMICNTSSTASHTLEGITVQIASFTSYSGPLNTWISCDGTYQRPQGVQEAGCGGGSSPGDEHLQATFEPGATTGAVAGVSATGIGVPSLPVSLGPGQGLYFTLAMTPPTVPGTYKFAFALSYDKVTNAPLSTSQPIILDSAAVKWTGQNCTKPALLSQIPPDDTQNRYVCAP